MLKPANMTNQIDISSVYSIFRHYSITDTRGIVALSISSGI
jgi:hypothetical protein